MKYWNRDKKIRQAHWHKIARPYSSYSGNYQTLKRELQLHDSTGKFYMYFGGDTIWFERSEDAVWFTLKLS